MKNNKAKILLSIVFLLAVLGSIDKVFASGPSVYVSPTNQIKTIGDTFNATVRVIPSGTKVCAVEGTINFSNLTCQSITVPDNLVPQANPTCSNHHFLIGIPSCTLSDTLLFTISVHAGVVGTGTISFTGVDIIGAGSSLGSGSVPGSYTVNALPTPTTAPTSTPTVVPTAVPTSGPTAVPTVRPTTRPGTTSAATPALTNTITPTETQIVTPTTVGIKLFDIALNVDNSLITNSSDLLARITFTSFGTVPTLVDLVYRIEDAKGNIVYTSTDNVTVETEQTVSKNFKSLALTSGKYTLFLNTTYGNNVQDVFRQTFEVKGLVINNDSAVWAIWIVVILAILGVGGFFIFRKNKGVTKTSSKEDKLLENNAI